MVGLGPTIHEFRWASTNMTKMYEWNSENVMLTNLDDDMRVERLEDLDRRHLIHPWTDLGAVRAQKPLIIDRAQGVHVYDIDGKRMIDGMGGMWCVNVGYGRD